ncbi:divalent-cation tolerance protein CutA [Chloroflexota bacterium]
MKAESKIVVLITTATKKEAQTIGELLLSKKKVACINIVPRVESLFRWQSKIDSAQESLLIIKSRASLLPEIIEIVKRAHSYEIPEIIALPIISGSEDYLQWVDGELEEA